jgi:hypothetical protein
MTKTKGISRKKAIVASNLRFAARRLAELLYTLLKNGTDYERRHFKVPGETGAEIAQLTLSA